jgi:hypothetical protein
VAFVILALDLGTHMGWACSDGQSGMQDFSTKRIEGGGMRFLRFQRWLETHDPSEIYFEEVRNHKGVHAAHVYGGFKATLMTFCEQHKIPYESVPVGTIKKHATGKGNAGKPQMVAAANRMGCKTQDDNEADAFCLLDYVIKQRAFE